MRGNAVALAGRALLAIPFAAMALLGCGAPAAQGAAPESERQAWESPPGASVPRGFDLPLVVRETAGVRRDGELAAGGVPLPRRLGLQSARGLAVIDAAGTPLPAELRVLARWPAPEGLGPVQWLWVAFPVSVEPAASAAYRIVAAEGRPAPSAMTRLHVARDAQGVAIDTGRARFVVRGDGALFAEVGRDGASPIATGRPLAAVVEGAEVRRHRARRLEVVRAGPLRAVVRVETELDRAPIGGGAVAGWWRYEFSAGSATALVREVLQWEGELGCPGCVEHAGRPAGVRLDGVRDDLVLAAPAVRATVLAARDTPVLESGAPDGSPIGASLRQLQRRDRRQPPRFTASAGGGGATGRFADRAVLAAGTERGTLAVAIRGLHHYEPQALALDRGVVRLALADGPAWLANRQGAFATLAVAALPREAGAAALESQVWAPLNRPLRPWPDEAWLARERPIDEVPFGPLPAALRRYDDVIPAVLRVTQEAVTREGVDGLMTFGVYPRYWGEHGFAELDCGAGGDPTPAERWDDTFWCGAWTDYHHTAATSAVWAMRRGELEWLDELAHPAALRVLHTQMMQCGPDDDWFYCHQAPTGYGAYRTDFNSSHAYFDNLLYYYRITGDETVVERLRLGAASLSRWARGKRDVVMRAAAQWQAIGRFLGTVGERDMESFFRWGVETAVAEHYLELQRGGEAFGFWSLPAMPSGQAVHSNLFSTAFYDFHNLHEAMLDTADAPLGPDRVRPSRALVSLARSYVRFAGTLEGAAGDIGGRWSRGFALRFAPPRVGGALLAVATEPGDPDLLYPGDKPAMAAFLVHAARLSPDPELRRAADELLAYSLERAAGQPLPLGKLMGLGLHRVHPAVAAVASDAAEGPPH